MELRRRCSSSVSLSEKARDPGLTSSIFWRWPGRKRRRKTCHSCRTDVVQLPLKDDLSKCAAQRYLEVICQQIGSCLKSDYIIRGLYPTQAITMPRHYEHTLSAFALRNLTGAAYGSGRVCVWCSVTLLSVVLAALQSTETEL